MARARVLDINPICMVDAHQAFVDGSTAQALLAYETIKMIVPWDGDV